MSWFILACESQLPMLASVKMAKSATSMVIAIAFRRFCVVLNEISLIWGKFGV